MRRQQTNKSPAPCDRRGARKSFRLPSIGAGGLFFCLLLAGCTTRTAPSATKPALPASGDTLAPGVVHRAIAMNDGTGVDLIDVDMRTAHVSLQIATEHIGRAGGIIGGQAYTPRDWLGKAHALASVNGGYFGRESTNGRKEFIGLLVQSGRVRHAAPPLIGHGSMQARAGRYTRAVLGFAKDGTPTIAYAATAPGRSQTLRLYPTAAAHGPGAPWPLQSGVGCGPLLIQNGQAHVTDRQERLASAGALPRTFVAYSTGRRPAHVVIGMASGMEYRALAAFLLRYFPRYDHAPACAALCLDGGASTQLSYRAGLPGAIQSPRDTGVTVPDAVVLVPRP